MVYDIRLHRYRDYLRSSLRCTLHFGITYNQFFDKKIFPMQNKWLFGSIEYSIIKRKQEFFVKMAAILLLMFFTAF